MTASPGTLPEGQVRSMFDRIAGVYDLMNQVMTVGLHHQWRRRAADLAGAGPGTEILDVACGTGDLAIEMAGRGARVIGSDFSEEMLVHARQKNAAITWEWANAMELPYADDRFDAATVGFGARNFSDLARGVAEMARVVRPGARQVGRPPAPLVVQPGRHDLVERVVDPRDAVEHRAHLPLGQDARLAGHSPLSCDRKKTRSSNWSCGSSRNDGIGAVGLMSVRAIAWRGSRSPISVSSGPGPSLPLWPTT